MLRVLCIKFYGSRTSCSIAHIYRLLRRQKINNVLNFFFLSIPFIILALLSRSLSVVAQIRGRIAGPPLPSLLRYVPSFLIARRNQHFLRLSTRVELCELIKFGALHTIFFTSAGPGRTGCAAVSVEGAPVRVHETGTTKFRF